MPKSPRIPEKATGEAAVIRRIRSKAGRFAGTGLSLGIGDDCALLRLRPGEEVAVTTDLSIAGRHFHMDSHPPEVVGYRALARGLSDLAAMGARPVAAFVSLGLPRELTVARARKAPWIERFYDGLLSLAATHKTPLAGGDLAESPVVVADIVLVGAAPAGEAVLRSGARAGDALYVTGNLGGAAAGLAQLGLQTIRRHEFASMQDKETNALAAHLYPQPRIAQGLWLRKRAVATAAIDLSDGLSTDLGHICEESGVAAEVDEALLPVHPAASLEQALHGGEDYELLFTARAGTVLPRQIAGVPLTQIGRIVRRRSSAPTMTLRTKKGREPLAPAGWQHFS